jgi:hypothetical protein
MAVRTVSVLALVFTALALVPYGAHLFALPNKIGMTQDQYFVAQLAYRNWWLVSLVLIPAMLLNIALAYLLYGEQPAFALALAACIVMISTLVIFFSFTSPANVATQNWTVAPADWSELRWRWEYSHAVNAGLMLVSFGLVALAVVLRR